MTSHLVSSSKYLYAMSYGLLWWITMVNLQLLYACIILEAFNKLLVLLKF